MYDYVLENVNLVYKFIFILVPFLMQFSVSLQNSFCTQYNSWDEDCLPLHHHLHISHGNSQSHAPLCQTLWSDTKDMRCCCLGHLQLLSQWLLWRLWFLGRTRQPQRNAGRTQSPLLDVLCRYDHCDRLGLHPALYPEVEQTFTRNRSLYRKKVDYCLIYFKFHCENKASNYLDNITLDVTWSAHTGLWGLSIENSFLNSLEIIVSEKCVLVFLVIIHIVLFVNR